MQQKIQTTHEPLNSFISIPGSQSITLRAILMAALADGVAEIRNIRLNDETRTLIKGLQQLGIVIQLDEKNAGCIIAGCKGRFPKKQTTVHCGNSINVTRLLLTAAAGTAGVFYFDAEKELRKQTQIQFFNIITQQGAQFIPSDIEKLPATLVGTNSLKGGDIFLENMAQTNLITALLIMAPYARTASTVHIREKMPHALINLTCSMMAEFGVMADCTKKEKYHVRATQYYKSCDYVVEPDLALASYFFAGAAITGGEVTIQSYKRSHSKQRNVKLLSIFEKMGCTVRETPTELAVKGPAELKGIDVSIRDFSDILVTLAAMAPFATSPTRIAHIGSLKTAEVKRMRAVISELTNLGIEVEAGANWIKIYPGKIRSATIDSHHDYHLAMAFSMIGLKIPDIEIKHTDCVTKKCPEFFKLLSKMTTEKVS